jgi:hypothetical protein
MKSAEYWIEHGPRLYPTSGDFIKAIQADALKQGVIDGIGLAVKEANK